MYLTECRSKYSNGPTHITLRSNEHKITLRFPNDCLCPVSIAYWISFPWQQVLLLADLGCVGPMATSQNPKGWFDLDIGWTLWSYDNYSS